MKGEHHVVSWCTYVSDLRRDNETAYVLPEYTRGKTPHAIAVTASVSVSLFVSLSVPKKTGLKNSWECGRSTFSWCRG